MRHALGSQRALAASEPNLSIMPAHILWIDKKAATEGHAIDKASNTNVASSRVSPDPPYFSET
jgi:hypothetical protein